MQLQPGAGALPMQQLSPARADPACLYPYSDLRIRDAPWYGMQCMQCFLSATMTSIHVVSYRLQVDHALESLVKAMKWDEEVGAQDPVVGG
eukprot:1159459-Pelagomonas_calceolata.AAC.2